MSEKIIGITTETANEIYKYHKRDEGMKFSIINLKDTKLSHKDFVVLERPRCEKDANYRHFASYVVIQNTKGEILAYPRAKGSTEERLHGNWSIGIGGHINVKDVYPSVITTFIENISSEILEELYENSNIDDNFSDIITESVFDACGAGNGGDNVRIIFDDSNEVGERHIAVSTRIVLNDFQVKSISLSQEVNGIEWIPYERLKEMMDSGERKFENWTKILIENWSEISGSNNPSACFYGEKPYA